MNQSLFDLYTDYLISSFGPTTATGLSRLLDEEISHDQITRLLLAPAKTSADLWRVVKPLIREVENENGVLIFDDSILEKPYIDENDLICWHWDHTKNRSVKGINFITAFYFAGTVGLPVALSLVTKTEKYIDPKTGKEKRRSDTTKNEYLRMLLHVCWTNQIRFKYVLSDSWYASADNMKYIKRDLSKEFVMPLKDNRKVALSALDRQQGRYQSVSTLEISGGETRMIWLEGVEFPLLLVKQVFKSDETLTTLGAHASCVHVKANESIT